MPDHEIIPASLAIKAMRDSGYRDAAHALAELVDNAIQAGARNVEVICLDKVEQLEERQRRRVDRIAVLDDGSGMSAEVLQMALQFGNGTHLSYEQQDGIGKFGMGLPNSSISQCQRVDVWTWQHGQTLHSYLDVEEIMGGTLRSVPVPSPSKIPSDVRKLASNELGKSGTLVLWSRLDRVRWKSSKALLDNSEQLIGRIYRYFLENSGVRIRLAAFSPRRGGGWTEDYDASVRPNDPLYLMKWTSCPELPAPYAGETLFEEFGEPDKIDVKLPGDRNTHTVAIRYSIVRPAVRKKLMELYSNAGNSPAGKHAARNIGISIVRAAREIEMSEAHVIGYDPVERFWGIEVSFPPALDELFGVTNNKQAATAFGEYNLDNDAAMEELGAQAFLEALRNMNDPRWVLYEVSRRIGANLQAMRKQLKRMTERSRTRDLEKREDPAEVAATKATRYRVEEGHVGQSDREEALPAPERTEDLRRKLEEMGTDPEEASEIAVSHVTVGLKYVFRQTPYEGPSFFSVTSRGGSIIVNVNRDHPVSPYLLELLEEAEVNSGSKALTALKLMLCAWARLEDETQNDRQRQRYTDVRDEWGRMTRQFLDTAYEE